MKWLAFVFLFFSGLLVVAQEDEKGRIDTKTVGEIGIPEKGRYYLPAHKHINIYSLPKANSKIFCKTKSFSDSLRILEVTNRNAIYNNIYGVWCKISFPLNGKRFIGYVPSQFLCLMSINQGTIKYLLLLEKYTKKTFTLSLKILKNYNLVSIYSFESPANDSYNPVEKDTSNQAMSGFMELTLFNNKGLDSVDNLLRLSTGVEACGYWWGVKYFVLKNLKVATEIEERSIGDADIYSYGCEHIFPIDSLGEANSIIKKIWSIEYFEEENYTETSNALVKYKWQPYHLNKYDSSYSSKKEKYLNN